MTPSFTPGPWYTIRDNRSTVCVYSAYNQKTICQLEVFDDDIPTMQDENARLIAAAPAQYKLLVESQTNIDGNWRERRDTLLKQIEGV